MTGWLRRKKTAAMKATTVVIPMMGKTPAAQPIAMVHASLSALIPCVSCLRMGLMNHRFHQGSSFGSGSMGIVEKVRFGAERKS